MPRNLLDMRFGIKNPEGNVSTVWKLWATNKGDVYLSVRKMTGIMKYSFHASGICRSAFTLEHGTPTTLSDRAMYKWKRSPTSEPGSLKASRVAWLAFPSDYLSRPIPTDDKKVFWITAAPPGKARFIELAFTRESEANVRALFTPTSQRELISFTVLPNGESFIFLSYIGEWENRDLKMPGEGKVADIYFSSVMDSTGRPIRIQFGPRPSDGDALLLQELGGYTV